MSIFPRPSKSNTGVFNADNNDTSNIMKLDFSNFLQRDNLSLSSELYLKSNVPINFAGVLQSSAYSEANKATNLLNESKLTNTTFNNGTTKMINNIDLTQANLLLTDESISINKITNLSNTLLGIQVNLNNITDNDADILALDNLTALHTSDLINKQTAIDSIELDITNNIKTGIISNTHLIETNITNITTNNDLIFDNLTSINLINNSSLPLIRTDINNLTTDVNNNFTAYNNNKTVTDGNIATNTTDILEIQNVDLPAIEANITSILLKNTQQDISINNLITLTTSHIDLIEDLNNITNDHSFNLTNKQITIDAHSDNLLILDGLTATNGVNIGHLQTQIYLIMY